MPRQRVKFAFIESAAKRKMTYQKRAESLMKKAKELSTLCGVMVSSIVYGPFDPEPKVWASPPGVHGVLDQYTKQLKTGKLRKMTNQETFVKKMINKVDEQVKKQQGLNQGRGITDLMLRCIVANNNRVPELNYFPFADIIALDQEVDRHLSEINKKIMQLQQQQPPPPPPSPPAAEGGGPEVFLPPWVISWLSEPEDDFVAFGGKLQPNSLAPIHHQDDL